jgi:hypothetical protein
LVTPGLTPPVVSTYNGVAANGVIVTATYNDITPTQHGSNSDYGYSLRGLFRWDAIPWVEYGSPGVNATAQIGAFAYHPPTNAEKSSGLASNIDHVLVRCDKNVSWTTISVQTANASAGNTIDWNFTIHTSDWSDGVHECEEVAVPTTGPDIIAEGPGVDQYGTLRHDVKATQATISNNAGGSGQLLIVPAQTFLNYNSGSLGSTPGLSIGMSVAMLGVSPNTFIDGDSTHNATSCVATSGSNCTGAGGSGTYHVTQASLTNTNEYAEFGIANSYYFLTNFGGTLYRPTYWVSSTGNDSTGNGSPGNPYATNGKAEDAITTGDGSTFHKAKYGGTVCFMGAVSAPSYLYSGVSLNLPESSIGWLVFQNASQDRCAVGGDQGNAQLQNSAALNGDRSWYPGIGKIMWRYIATTGTNAPTNYDPTAQQELAVDHVTNTKNPITLGGMLSGAATYCVESTGWFGGDQWGNCAASILIRNVNLKYTSIDCFHDTAVVVNSTCDQQGLTYFWATGNSTSGSNVVTNVTISPAELSGYTLTQLFAPAGTPSTTPPQPQFGLFDSTMAAQTSCFPATLLYVSAATSNTLTIVNSSGVAVNATSSCTNGWISLPGAHTDNYQHQSGNPGMDLIIAGNTFGATQAADAQGEFLETAQISGAYVGHNVFKNWTGDSQSLILSTGGLENYMSDQNSYVGNNSFRMDNAVASKGETYIKDTGPGGCSIVPTVTAGTNQRTLAAVSSACYTTSTP